MELQEIYIENGEYLNDIIPQIQTNTIINKTICGCGATTLELNTYRNSIIIEPNLPVILGKEIKHENLLGVYEGVTSKHIEKYLIANYNKTYYKIMTTPESFGKIRRAVKNFGMNLYKDFFILFDECEKTTQDIDYRKTIILPINDFFRSEKKAMVSATPVRVEDPRFEEQNFNIINIKPTYDYRKNLTLIPTNNVYTALKKTLTEISEDNTICIFHNSTKSIDLIIEYLGIKKKSNIYCSTESKDKLIDKGYTKAYDTLNKNGEDIKFNKYNFFTSRFYSAVDIELPYKPIVILVTELFSAPYSIIDPCTEAIQISGRFRNGIKELMHITNYNKKAKFKKQVDIENFLNEQHNIYTQFRRMWVNTNLKGERFILQQAMDKVDYANFVLSSGSKNLFMYHNVYRDEYLKMIYRNIYLIKNEYENSKAFNIKILYSFFCTTDKDRKILKETTPVSQIKLNKSALEQIRKLMYSKNPYDKEYLAQIIKSYKDICEGFYELGYKKIVELGYKTNEIKKEIERKKIEKVMLSPNVKKAIYKVFKENTRYTTAEINKKLMLIFDRYKITYKKSGCSGRIKLYFDIEPDNKNENRGWKLISKRYNVV